MASEKTVSSRRWLKRPLRLAIVGLLVLLVGFVGYTQWEYFRHPIVISHDYVADFHALMPEVHPDEAAYPTLREIAEALPWPSQIAPPGPEIEGRAFERELTLWNEVQSIYPSLRDNIAQIHDVVDRPLLGFRLEAADPANLRDFAGMGDMSLMAMPKLMRWLLVEAALAEDQVERESLVRALNSVLRLAYLQREVPSYTVRLFAHGPESEAYRRIHQLATHEPALLDLDDLAWLQETIASRPSVTFPLAGDLLLVWDAMQHGFSDRGDGDGYVSVTALAEYFEVPSNPMGTWPVLGLLPYLTVWGGVPSRRQTREIIEDYMTECASMLEVPFWEREFVDGLGLDDSGPISPLVWNCFSSSPGRKDFTHRHLEIEAQLALTLLAAGRYHAEQGHWPAEWEAFVPDYLPEVPLCLLTGKPLVWRLHEGRPLVYSLGPDGQDHGGWPTETPWNELDYGAVLEAVAAGNPDGIEGDWVLWPPEATRRQEDGADEHGHIPNAASVDSPEAELSP